MLFRVLSTECLKLKRTLALWMVLVSPLLMVLLQFTVSYKRGPAFLHDGKDAWTPMVRQTVQVWTLLMMPLFVTLETALLAGLENAGNNWKALLALPAERWTVYAAKLAVAIGLLWSAHALLIAGTLGSGWVLKAVFPAMQMGNLPLAPFVAPMARVSLCALLGVAIQHWVSLRWRSFTVAVGFGICAMIAGVFAAQSEMAGTWFPWSLPIHAALDGAAGKDGVITMAAIFGAMLAAGAGCWEFVRREVG